jgi:hypothetical protein
MLNKLRKFFFSVPVMTATGLFALYLVCGFFVLPSVVKWQVEKQVTENLGQRINVGEVHFNPLAFRFEAGDFVLSDPEGGPLVSFKRLLVDFELRSAIDRAWTFAHLTLEAPVLRFDIDKEGRHNFTTLLKRLRDNASERDADPLPQFVFRRVKLNNARIEFQDRLLDEPLVARIDPLQIEIDNLSSLSAQAASYRLSGRTAAGETFESNGDLALNPIFAKGKLKLNDVKVATLARGLSRLIALEPPAGEIDFSVGFDFAVDSKGTISGFAQDIALDVAALSIAAPGGGAPLLVLESFSLKKGRIDLGKREAMFTGMQLAKGSVSIALDKTGRADWANLMRASAPKEEETAAKPASAASPRGEQNVTQGMPWRITVANAEVSDIAVSYSDAARGQVAQVGTFGLGMSASAEFGGKGTLFELSKPRLSFAGAQFGRGADVLGVPVAVIEAGRVAFNAADRGFELVLDAPRISAADGINASQGDAALELRNVALEGGRFLLNGADAAIKGAIDDPKITLSGISISGSAQNTRMRNIALEGKRLAMQSAPQRLDLNIDKLSSLLSELQLQRAADSVKFHTAAITGEKLSLVRTDGLIRVAGNAAQVSVAGLAAQQGSDRMALQDAAFDAKTISVSAGSGAEDAAVIDARFGDAALRLAALSAVAQGAPSELLQVANASFGAKSLALNFSGGPLDLNGDGLTVVLSDAIVRDPADASELLRVGSATLAGGVLRLKDRIVSLEKITFAKSKAQTGFDAKGQFNWTSLLRAAAPDTGVKKSQPPDAPAVTARDTTAGASATQAAPQWRIALKSAELDDFALGFVDKRQSPAFAVGLEAMRARIAGLDTGSASPMQLEVQAKVAGGGEIEASGPVRADNGNADLKLKIAAVALAPLQTYLSEFAELQLANGTLSGEGRLRYGDAAAAGAKFAYEGSIALDRFVLEEVEPRRPFLAWNSVASGDVVLTLAPNRLDIGELRVERPSGRLIIAEDQTLNLTDVLKKPKQNTGTQSNVKPSESGGEQFPVMIARVRVSDGVLEFADLSLRPQFGTRMHELKGVITGLGSDANRSAKVQLDARVDKYGSAKIRGQLSVRQPEKFTDIDMAFRNLELTSLSAYIAKFAGYRIASGRLALDLHYKVKDGKLLGENKIVLHQVELGEKVDSPNALDLPLELAIAILKDSDGVIDIGLPVSGDLNDPQFDYGEIVGKAFANLLGSIITAPFRALGALFGGGSAKELGMIDFEPGNDVLAPPERQKLEAVARALKGRPALMLVVPPTYAAGEDTPVLKLLAVHTDIVRRMGVNLMPGENPGPIDTANPRVQSAVEAAFSQRYAPEVLALLKRRAVDAAGPAGESAQESSSAAVSPAASGASQPTQGQTKPPPAFYQNLVQRLIREQPIDDQMLAQLASQRSAAIIRELTTVGSVPASRISLGDPHQADDANEKAVTLRLQLEVSK